ncbi:unnamed protein product [Polarella glacialis]|uniref:Major facilitator superfamily (MFS) profile domain-containing protein n=1 Tax=Polarella glacialis TaxID=89957 RepID=A0A813LWM6_POLGL|nr:unnamed protein product [Polarella glacialis]
MVPLEISGPPSSHEEEDSHSCASWTSFAVLPKSVPSGRFRRQPGAHRALLALSCINMLNIADRYVPSAVKPLIQAELQLDDAQSSYPAVAMTVVFMTTALFFGICADKELVDRRILLAGGIAFWSLATALAGLATNLWQLIFFRALVGVGEAAFATVASPMIADYYPAHERNRSYTIFNLAAPLGGALGFGAGSMLGKFWGWRYAFLACGVPGILVAFSVLLLEDPEKGINDACESQGDSKDSADSEVEQKDESSSSDSEDGSAEEVKHRNSCITMRNLFQEIVALFANPYFMLSTAGMVGVQFAIGGLSEWYPTFLQRYDGLGLGTAGMVLAGGCVIGGIGGTVLGAKVAESAARRIGSQAYFLVPAVFMVPGAALCILCINITGHSAVAIVCLILGMVCFFTFQGPIATLSMSVIPARSRARGSSLQILLLHVLGDVVSPPIIGMISDATGSLKTALQVTWVAILMAGMLWFCGYFLPPPPMSVGLDKADSGHLMDVLRPVRPEVSRQP